ncbi:Hypothetical protein NocV09_01700650 [Nannochloropsis oceanica]
MALPPPLAVLPAAVTATTTAAAAAAASSTAAASGSIVFLCAACRRIVGDSLGLTSADEDLRHITLHGACGIVRGPCPRTSEEGKDLGSTFHELFCEGCNALLGKVYLTTPAPLDGARNLFTLSTDALESFELGNYDHTCELPAHLMPTPPAASREGAEIAAGGGGEGGPPHAAMQLELTKVQNMMLVFHDRISSLERALKEATIGAGATDWERKGGGDRENVGAVGNKFKRKK